VEELFASFFGGALFSVGLYALVEFIIIVFSKEKENSKSKPVTYDDKILKPVNESPSNYPPDYYSAKAVYYRVAKDKLRHNKEVVSVFFSYLDFDIDHRLYNDSQVILETGIYDIPPSYNRSIFLGKKDLRFLSLYLSLYYGFDTKVEDKENNGKYYSVLYVSWEDPKVPLTVFNKGED
jgi:hypothetical protein